MGVATFPVMIAPPLVTLSPPLAPRKSPLSPPLVPQKSPPLVPHFVPRNGPLRSRRDVPRSPLPVPLPGSPPFPRTILQTLPLILQPNPPLHHPPKPRRNFQLDCLPPCPLILPFPLLCLPLVRPPFHPFHPPTHLQWSLLYPVRSRFAQLLVTRRPVRWPQDAISVIRRMVLVPCSAVSVKI